jgi:hypothetical protein
VKKSKKIMIGASIFLSIALIAAMTLAATCGMRALFRNVEGTYSNVGVPYSDVNIWVPSLNTVTYTRDMDRGEVIEGYILVDGGDETISFRMKDSWGDVVVDAVKVKTRYDFSYRAASSGPHTLLLTNAFFSFKDDGTPVIATKHVFLHCRVR